MTVQPRELTPSDLVHDARREDEFAFVRLHRGAAFIAVRLLDDAPELEGGLKHVAGNTLPVRPILATMAFKTQAVSASGTHTWRLGLTGSVRPSARSCSLPDGRHHLVRLAKREGVANNSSQRISVGRAATEDLVLRHMSISKFHAWFEMDEALRWHVTDAGSMNHTFVNDLQLQPRVRTLVAPGNQLRMGSVDVVFLDAATLWNAVRESS